MLFQKYNIKIAIYLNENIVFYPVAYSIESIYIYILWSMWILYAIFWWRYCTKNIGMIQIKNIFVTLGLKEKWLVGLSVFIKKLSVIIFQLSWLPFFLSFWLIKQASEIWHHHSVWCNWCIEKENDIFGWSDQHTIESLSLWNKS